MKHSSAWVKNEKKLKLYSKSINPPLIGALHRNVSQLGVDAIINVAPKVQFKTINRHIQKPKHLRFSLALKLQMLECKDIKSTA